MAEQGGFLDNAYDVSTGAETQALYNDWAATYEAEVRANGYATPGRCAEALGAVGADKAAPLLDLGCGTGLSGEAFRAAGFAVLDGSDFSAEMLDVARGKAGLYRHLTLGDINRPIPAAPGDYATIAAVGVFSPHHGKPDLIETVVDLLPAGGFFVFSLNDHALAEPGYESTVAELVEVGRISVVHDSYGTHMPGKGLQAKVLVVKRL